MKRHLILASIFLFAGSITIAQTDTIQKENKGKECEQQALGDLFRKKGKAPKPPKKLSALILPNIGSTPTTGFVLGVGGALGWYMGPKEHTKVSSAAFTAAVTSKDQLITFVKPNIYTQKKPILPAGRLEILYL